MGNGLRRKPSFSVVPRHQLGLGLADLGQALEGPTIPDPVTAIPWPWVGAIALVVPLIAMLAAAAFTRSRLPEARRIAD